MIKELEPLLKTFDCTGYRWIDPKEVVVSHWVRMKCMFGCDSYGRVATCPPNTVSIEEARAILSEYDHGVIIHFAKKLDRPEDRKDWTKELGLLLVKLEQEVFLRGYYKAFLLMLDECRLCSKCPGKRAECKNPVEARPSMEAMVIDVFATVRKFGFPIDVLDSYEREMNRYALLLVD